MGPSNESHAVQGNSLAGILNGDPPPKYSFLNLPSKGRTAHLLELAWHASRRGLAPQISWASRFVPQAGGTPSGIATTSKQGNRIGTSTLPANCTITEVIK